MAMHFMCPHVEASMRVPPRVGEAEITSGSCGNVLGTWGEFKERARMLIHSRVSAGEAASNILAWTHYPIQKRTC